ncbi:MAG: NAD-dependent deacylase [Candidatus Electryoneaceae bacterium]|nr:NAD-dependent deacylase [Candidatus Electryoneaceae bacterium]
MDDHPTNDSLADDPQVVKFRELLNTHQRIVAFTGAGISAESGIPTYRGAGGTWTKYDPEKYASINYFVREPTYYWSFFRDVRHDLMNEAEPNLAHLALVELEKRGQLSAVITQNIDGLHIKAGSKRVLELHGNTTRFYCFDCHAPYTMKDAKSLLDEGQMPPRCAKCKGVLRPDVVLFGEMLPTDVTMEAEQESRLCDLMLVIGSSLVVYPAAQLPYTAKQSNAALAIINVDPTPMDQLADLVINRPAGEILAAAVGL